MALKALMLKKKITDKRSQLNTLTEKDQEFDQREADLMKSIDEASTDEERSAVESEIEKFEKERDDHNAEKSTLETEVNGLEDELREIEEADKQLETAPKETEREDKKMDAMEVRTVIADRNSEVFQRDDVKAWLGEIREHIANKRELTNVGLTIPEVFLGMLRQNVEGYSKLYKHVNVVRISGTGREVIMGSVPEGIWTECCANLNELTLGFNDVEVDCYKVGGYFKVCNATLEDSDVQLANIILDAIGQAIGLALDKAILFGRNTATNYKMPMGILSRLAQTSEPADYPATARTWVDLHSTNMIAISDSMTGIELFKAIVAGSGNIKGKYARGTKTWVMNEKTYTALQVAAMSINAAGAIVSGQTNTMPIVGGGIEILDFVPDNIIIGGYFELYLLAERAGQKFAQSEHAFFLQDQTAFKGTARYDGVPVIAEAFATFGINGTAPTTTMVASVQFAADTANPGA